MSDAIEKAARDAVEAADNTELTRQIAAILVAQQLLNQQQPPATVGQQPKVPFNATQWLVIGGVVVSVGLVASLFAIAVAIGATCATVCLLILRSVWQDVQKGR